MKSQFYRDGFATVSQMANGPSTVMKSTGWRSHHLFFSQIGDKTVQMMPMVAAAVENIGNQFAGPRPIIASTSISTRCCGSVRTGRVSLRLPFQRSMFRNDQSRYAVRHLLFVPKIDPVRLSRRLLRSLFDGRKMLGELHRLRHH